MINFVFCVLVDVVLGEGDNKRITQIFVPKGFSEVVAGNFVEAVVLPSRRQIRRIAYDNSFTDSFFGTTFLLRPIQDAAMVMLNKNTYGFMK